MRRRLLAFLSLTAILGTTLLACEPVPKPTVSFSYTNLRHTDQDAPGAQVGDIVDYTFRVTNAPAGSRLLFQHVESNRWITKKTIAVKPTGSATVLPPFGRNQYRLALVGVNGAVLASAAHRLDTYREFTLSALSGLATRFYYVDKVPYPYDFVDAWYMDNTSCRDLNLIAFAPGPPTGTGKLAYVLGFTGMDTASTFSVAAGVSREVSYARLKLGSSWAETTTPDGHLFFHATLNCLTSTGHF